MAGRGHLSLETPYWWESFQNLVLEGILAETLYFFLFLNSDLDDRYVFLDFDVTDEVLIDTAPIQMSVTQ